MKKTKRSSRYRYMWVVEMDMSTCFIGSLLKRYRRRGSWEPTVGVAFSRRKGRAELAEWKRDNPDVRFRLVRYTP